SGGTIGTPHQSRNGSYGTGSGYRRVTNGSVAAPSVSRGPKGWQTRTSGSSRHLRVPLGAHVRPSMSGRLVRRGADLPPAALRRGIALGLRPLQLPRRETPNVQVKPLHTALAKLHLILCLVGRSGLLAHRAQ